MTVRGSAQAMQTSFSSFGFGLILSRGAGLPHPGRAVPVVRRSTADSAGGADRAHGRAADPLSTGTTLNIMSLMGVVMMVGIVVSNSILIVEFTHRLASGRHERARSRPPACRVRLRPVLMTSLATVIGLIPMALKLGTGSEAYAPLARAIIGGLIVSVAVTVFLVPAAYLLMYRNRPASTAEAEAQ